MSKSPRWSCSLVACLSLPALLLVGCDQPELSADQLAEFERARPLQPTVDVSSIKRASLPIGPYKVVPDDVLELHMPLVLADLTTLDRQTVKPVMCRVNSDGMIGLPIAGALQVAGKTLAQIEREVVQAYCPKYVKRLPSVMARVFEPHTAKVRVQGAIKVPGVHSLRSDEMTLVSAIMKAGGILPEGAAAIRLRHPGKEDDDIMLPVSGLNIPFADVELSEGDEIEVARINLHTIAVVGLVKKPGVFAIEPTGVAYNLAQAMALAEGPDRMANPRYAKICRQGPKGALLTRPVRIDGEHLSFAAGVPVRAGDVVVLENTLETDLRMILLEIMRVSVSASYSIK
jgi:polysaccharide export outer membrane protein